MRTKPMKQVNPLPYSIMVERYVRTGETTGRLVVVTAIRMVNDINGNSRYKLQVWTSVTEGSLWTPKVKGYRRTKDDSYVLKCVHDVYESMDYFMSLFEVSINEL